MPLSIKIDVTLPKGDYPRGNWRKFDRDLQRYMKGELSKAIEDEYERTIRGWKKRIIFRGEFSKGRRSYTLEVVPKGEGADIYGWVDAGTRRRSIYSRGSYPMVFQAEYTPKTTKAGRVGGSGRKYGPWVKTHKVSNHKIEAREFTPRIARKMEKKTVLDITKMMIEDFGLK